MAHAQKPNFFFRRNGRVHLNRRGRQFSRLLAAEVCGISGSNAGYTMFRGSVKSTGCPLHSPVSPSLPLTCVTVCHHISTGLSSIPISDHHNTLIISQAIWFKDLSDFWHLCNFYGIPYDVKFRCAMHVAGFKFCIKMAWWWSDDRKLSLISYITKCLCVWQKQMSLLLSFANTQICSDYWGENGHMSLCTITNIIC